MSIAHMIPKEQKEEIRCPQCGSSSTSPGAREGRSKCNDCSFSFDNDASKAAEKAGAIPDASPETLALATNAEIQHAPESTQQPTRTSPLVGNVQTTSQGIPRTPKFVFISRDRRTTEFCGAQNIKKTALRWEASEVKYDCYELSKKQSVVKLEIE